ECNIGDICVVHGDCSECKCSDGRAAKCDREHGEPPHCSCSHR
uniref:Perlinhibin-related protein n=1 Tax=Haliotis laevigata TaxID=36097 RepID=PLINR_HALLA|nr:RecName: Full=Perlinhibin-related protein [Haliotis laevigata]